MVRRFSRAPIRLRGYDVTVNVRTVVLVGWALVLGACAGPTSAQRAEQGRVARLMMKASAVHMPPSGVASCVGVTIRLTDPSGKAEAERKSTELFISADEARAAFETAGLSACRDTFVVGLEDAGLSPEPLHLTVGFGVDPQGKVCAIVERPRTPAIDPAAGPMVDQAAQCLKNVLFSAQLPVDRVQGKSRMVRMFSLSVNAEMLMTGTSTKAG